MATFDDSDDIKISTTLDTEGAIKAAQDLKTSIENAIKATATQFDKLQQASKQLGTVLKAQSEKEVSQTKQKLDQVVNATSNAAQQEVAIAQQTADQKVAVVEKAIKRTISAEQRRIQELKVAAKQEMELEKTKRTQILKDIAELNLKRAVVRKTPRSELPEELGGIAGAGKIADAFSKTLASMSVQLGNVNIGLGTFVSNFKQFGATGAAVASLTTAIALIKQFDQEIDRLAASANKIEGLRAGFETLQRTVGQDPSQSINKLREATQGLVSDIDLYQRANQAVLLGVPTGLFNEAAAAAVKLGRAMGIDAAFGLESLSLGLGRQSRLYLDNLGIIVSAEEAYQRFASAVGKSAQDLTDAEKRAAFFEEALRKIKERAEQLPDPLDNVGVSLQKLQAAQANAEQKFSEGFNSASLLTKAYQEQAKIAQQSVGINEKFGQAVGVLSGVLKITANSFRDFGLVSKVVFSDLVGAFADLTKEEQLSTLEGKIEKLKISINGLRESRSKADLGPTLTARLAEEEQALIKAQEEAEKLRQEIVKLRGEAQNPIKINVDLTEITQAQNTFKNFFATLKQQASEAGGNIQVPGISADTINQVSKAYQDLYLKQLQGKLTQEQFNAEFAKIESTVALSSAAGEVEKYAKQVSNLTEQIRSGQGDTTELTANLETARQKYEAAKEAAGLYGNQVEQLGKVLKNAEGAAKKTFSETERGQTRTSGAIQKTQKDFESFVKSLRRSLGTAIPGSFQKELVEIFNKGSLSAQDLEVALIDLGRRAKAAGVDMEAFKKEVSELQKLAEQGIEIKIDADTTKAKQKIEQDIQENLKRIQAEVPNIRELIYGKDPSGKAQGGGFFGFDTKDIVGPETQKQMQVALGEETFAGVEAAIAKKLIEVLQVGVRLAFEKFTRDDAPQIAEEIGTVLGGDIGGIIGKLIGENIRRNTRELASTRERKKIDAYFSELFDGNRLAVVIDSQIEGAFKGAESSIKDGLLRISDISFEGEGAFGGGGGFGSEQSRAYFNTLSSDVQSAFNGIGLALGRLQGISVEQSRLIAAALANNIGGSLQNLQILVQATGESFESLSEAIIQSFLDAQISIEEAYNSLLKIKDVFEVGIPGAIGDYEQAIDNFARVIESKAPGRYLVDSFRDIGAEAAEATGASFNSVVTEWASRLGFTGEKVQLFFALLARAGITTFEQLRNASDETIISILAGIGQIRDGVITTAEQVNKFPIVSSIKPPSAPKVSAPKGKSPEQTAREKLREETQKLLRESIEYEKVLKRITDGEISRAAAGAEIIKLQEEIRKALERRNDLEKKLQEELDKGRKANKKRLADLASQLDAVNEKIGNFTKKAEESTRQFKQLNISGVIPFIKSANTLGVIAKQVGVSFEKATDILIQGFLKGRLSLAELNKELKSTKETLGPGIPNAVGAVTDAFQNLIDAGTQGGQFSVDAFTDIFAEFREKFQTEGSALREAERKQLNENLTAAREAFANAVGPEATAAAKKTLDEAKKALDDFYAAAPAPDLADLRAELERQFGADQVNLFFQALDESGLKTFEDFEKAGTDSIVGILAKLQTLGFQFNQTSEEIIKANEELNNAEQAANGGLDPLQEAINLIKGLNEGAGQLPPVFNSTTKAVEGLNGPLAALKTGFDDIIEKLGLLSGQTYENDVVFNVRTVGDTGSKALVEIIFGDGANTTKDVAPTTPGNAKSGASQIAEWKAEIRRIQKLPSTERRRKELKRLRNLIAEAGG